MLLAHAHSDRMQLGTELHASVIRGCANSASAGCCGVEASIAVQCRISRLNAAMAPMMITAADANEWLITKA